jgi:hypothetical protein
MMVCIILLSVQKSKLSIKKLKKITKSHLKKDEVPVQMEYNRFYNTKTKAMNELGIM